LHQIGFQHVADWHSYSDSTSADIGVVPARKLLHYFVPKHSDYLIMIILSKSLSF